MGWSPIYVMHVPWLAPETPVERYQGPVVGVPMFAAVKAQAPWREAIEYETWSLPVPLPEHMCTFRADWGDRRRVIIVRFLIAAYMTAWLILSIVGCCGDVGIAKVVIGPINFGWKWLIYLTNWSFTVLTVYLWCAWLAAATPLHESPKFGRLVWTLRNVTAISALVVSSINWTILFPDVLVTDMVDVHLHAVNSLVILADLALSPLPYYIKHWWQSLTYLGVYLTFSIVYWAEGQTDPDGSHAIYPPLNYHHPLMVTGLVVGTTFIVVPTVNWLLWLYVRVWERVAERRVLAKSQRGYNELEKPMV